jgi:hypothetical protein
MSIQPRKDLIICPKVDNPHGADHAADQHRSISTVKNRLENNIETSRHCQHFRFTTCVTSFVLVSAKLRRMRLCSAPCATSPETKRHYQCGMADQVRNEVDKTNKRLYGKRAASHFRDGPTSNHEEVKIAVCN